MRARIIVDSGSLCIEWNLLTYQRELTKLPICHSGTADEMSDCSHPVSSYQSCLLFEGRFEFIDELCSGGIECLSEVENPPKTDLIGYVLNNILFRVSP